MTAIESNATLHIGEPVCPTCKLSVHPVAGSILIVGGIGTYAGGWHGHVICPCGWWTETGPREDPLKVAQAHAEEHGGQEGGSDGDGC